MSEQSHQREEPTLEGWIWSTYACPGAKQGFGPAGRQRLLFTAVTASSEQDNQTGTCPAAGLTLGESAEVEQSRETQYTATSVLITDAAPWL